MLRRVFEHYKVKKSVVHGIAHITGGGICENLQRILPDEVQAEIDRGSWTVPPVFPWLQQLGDVNEPEMYRVFNMGIGMVVVCSPKDASRITKALPEARIVGEVVKLSGETRVIID